MRLKAQQESRNLLPERSLKINIKERLRRNYETQRIINKILRLSLEDYKLEEILKKSLDLLLSAGWLSFDATGVIFLATSDKNGLVMTAQQGISPLILKKCKQIAWGKCICGLAAQQKKIILADSNDTRHTISHPDISPHGHYCLPIILGKQVLGVLNVYVSQGHCYNKEEKTFLKLVTNSLAGIIYRQKLEKERFEAEEKLLESYKHLGAVNRQVAILLDLNKKSGGNNSQEIIKYIVNSAANLSQAKSVAFYEYQNSSKSLTLLSSVGLTEHSKRIFKKISFSEHPYLSPLLKKSRVQGNFLQKGSFFSEKRSHSQYFLLLPLITGNRMRGALFLNFANHECITTQELDFYEAFAAQASFVIQNMKLPKKDY